MLERIMQKISMDASTAIATVVHGAILVMSVGGAFVYALN